MLYLVAQPEVSYVRDAAGEVIERWYPPSGCWFKFTIQEFPNGATLDELKSKLMVGDQPIELTKEEIAYYKKRYGHGGK